MVDGVVGLHVLFLGTAACTTAILAGYAWFQPEQGTGPFVGLLAAITVYSGTHLLGLLTVHPEWRLVWEQIQWTSTAVVPVFWLLFAMTYTGHDELITTRIAGGLSVVPLLTVLLVWTNPFHRRLFELVPATRQLARDVAIRQLEEGVAIVDTDRQVIYCNPGAGDILDCEPAAAIGRPIRSLVDECELAFETEDALAELERGDATFEVRTSPIRGRRDRLTGHTLIIQDVTARKRRERELVRHRDELERLNELNGVIRGVNRALVSATTREDVERAVCERLADVDLYGTVCAADVPTWKGDADRWTTAGRDDGEPALPPALQGEEVEVDTAAATPISAPASGTERGTWTFVPLVHGRMVYGGIGLLTRRAEVPEEEREVLAELGELTGHAINAIEHRRLVAAEAASETDVRRLRDRIRQAFPETRLDAKREHDRPIDSADGVPTDAVEDLTGRQREALEAACRAGYYDWPRESTAEDVATALAIAYLDRGGTPDVGVYDHIGEVWATYGESARQIPVDVPVGLCESLEADSCPCVETDGTLSRRCDDLAREVVGPRSSSVFTPPAREAAKLAAKDREHSAVSERNRELTGKWSMQQAANISTGIVEVEQLLLDDGTWRAIARALGDVDHRVQLDDVLDALTLALTALAPADEFHRLPPDPPTDPKGLPMQMVYRRSQALPDVGSGPGESSC